MAVTVPENISPNAALNLQIFPKKRKNKKTQKKQLAHRLALPYCP